VALALVKGGRHVYLYGRRSKSVPPPLELVVGPSDEAPPWLSQVVVLLLAVRDDAIGPLAQSLAASKGITAGHTVLHLSGSLGREALEPLEGTGAALGSWHPLQSIADPERAAETFQGAWAAVEGDDRAAAAGQELARQLGMRPFRLPSTTKTLYHAAAVFASNYLVVVEGIAERLARHAGIPRSDAWSALKPLFLGTTANLAASDPMAALTGPIARGDVDTVRRHLAVLAAEDARLYRALGRAALEMAIKRGLDRGVAGELAALLHDPGAGGR
jgi:predicted short-subunit dehydrogenase-like oxidoreductase (DUF2520 family)